MLTRRQGGHVLRVGLVCAGVLFLTWWLGPYGPRAAPAFATGPNAFYWIWSGFFAFAVLASLLVAPFSSHAVTIAEKEVIAERSFYWWRSSHRVPRAEALGIWTETIDDVEEGAMFPYRLHLLDAEGRASGVCFELQRRRGVEQMLEALRAVLTLDVRDRRPPSGGRSARTQAGDATRS